MFLEHLLSVVIVAETGFYAAPESWADFKMKYPFTRKSLNGHS